MYFEERAADYGAARPPYPPELWARLRTLGRLRPGGAALDLGAGSGQATGPLLDAGLHVTAVEPGPTLARLLQHAYPQADVRVTRAEDMALASAAFDLVVAATSIHWMDLEVVLPKVHDALAPGGRFVVWRHVFGDPEAAETPFRSRVAQIVRARETAPRPDAWAEDRDATIRMLTASGLFAVEDVSTFRWSLELDGPGIGLLFRTFSDWSDSEVQQAVDAVAELGGSVTEHYSSWMVVLAPLRRGPCLPTSLGQPANRPVTTVSRRAHAAWKRVGDLVRRRTGSWTSPVAASGGECSQ